MSEALRAQKRIEELFGPEPRLDARLLHVAAVWEAATDRWRFIEIGDDSPESETDRFVLDFARARADAVLTTGAILRAEPDVTHGIETPCLRSWRGEVLGKPGAPESFVLTSGRGLDPEHPLFAPPRPATLLAPEDAELPSSLAGSALRMPELDPARAIEYVLDRFETMCLEVGPSVTVRLYESHDLVDELLLSVFLGRMAPHLAGGDFPSPARVRERLPLASEPRVSREASGPWRFHRFLRRH